MGVVTININAGYFAEFLGEEKAKLVPEAVIRAAESNMERFLVNHSEEFHSDLNQAIEKAIDENHEVLVAAGAVIDISLDEDDADGEDADLVSARNPSALKAE